MLRSLGITTAIRWFVIACVALAIWRGFNGDIGAIVDAVWSWIQTGAEVVTNIWHEVDKGANKGK